MDVFCVVPCCAKGDVVNRENDKKVSSTAIFSLYSATIFSPHSTAILHSALHNHFLSALRCHYSLRDPQPFSLHTPQPSFSPHSAVILLAVLHSHPFLSTPQRNGRESFFSHTAHYNLARVF